MLKIVFFMIILKIYDSAVEKTWNQMQVTSS